jgi:hypothetical protein
MTEKKPYSPPQLFRVELSQEQAILSACSLTASNPMAGGADIRCRAGACKKAAGAGVGDSGQRPS